MHATYMVCVVHRAVEIVLYSISVVKQRYQSSTVESTGGTKETIPSDISGDASGQVSSSVGILGGERPCSCESTFIIHGDTGHTCT